MNFEPYRPGQGVAGRSIAGVALGILVLFGSIRAYYTFPRAEEPCFALSGLDVTYGMIAAVACFSILGFSVALFCCGWTTGLKSVDARTRAFTDLLVETQAELQQKVAWPSREELYSSTTVVLISTVLIGVMIFFADFVISTLMQWLGILPKA